jgi:hypothetical protein
MYSISKKISVGQQASVVKSTFINNEIVQPTVIQFKCCHCGHENTVEIKPYESGFPILQIYNENKVLSKNELLKNGMVIETNKDRLHVGELTVNNLPTLYFGTKCQSCDSKYIGVFSYGEKQPGLELLTISGIWKYEEIE